MEQNEMVKKQSIIIILSLIIVFTVGCSTPGKVEPLHIKLQQDLVIEDSDENQYQNFSFIQAAAVDEKGDIYLIDKRKLLKFDKSGKFIWVIDKMGQGPGEFLRVVDLAVTNNGKVIYADQDSRKIIIFSNAGEFIDEFKVKEGMPFRVDVDSEGFIYCNHFEGTSDYLLHKYNQDGKLLKSFLKRRCKEEDDATIKEAKNWIRFFISSNDNIYVTYVYEYKMMKFDKEGNLIKEWIGQLPFKPKKMKIIEPQPGWLTLDADKISQDIAVDKRENVYILWGSRPTENGFVIDIFDSQGKQLGNFFSGVKPDPDANIQHFYIDRNDYLYIIKTGENPKLVRFKMIRG